MCDRCNVQNQNDTPGRLLSIILAGVVGIILGLVIVAEFF